MERQNWIRGNVTISECHSKSAAGVYQLWSESVFLHATEIKNRSVSFQILSFYVTITFLYSNTTFLHNNIILLRHLNTQTHHIITGNSVWQCLHICFCMCHFLMWGNLNASTL